MNRVCLFRVAQCMFTLRMFTLLIAPSIFVVGVCRAEEGVSGTHRGLITTGSCPLTCEDLSVPRDKCREQQSGLQCSVEDLRQGPGHRSVLRVPRGMEPRADANRESSVALSEDASRRGLVTSAPCPYSCKQAGLSLDVCRERQAGDVCQIEDLTQAPGHRSLLRIP